MASVEKKSWSSPDGSQSPDKTHAATITFGPITITKANMQPGWKWSECIKPHVGTDSCQAGHIGVLMQGTIHVASDDGTEITINAGDEGFEAYTQHHFKTVSCNINILAGPAYWSTIKTLPATLPKPRSEIREPSFGKLDP